MKGLLHFIFSLIDCLGVINCGHCGGEGEGSRIRGIEINETDHTSGLFCVGVWGGLFIVHMLLVQCTIHNYSIVCMHLAALLATY